MTHGIVLTNLQQQNTNFELISALVPYLNQKSFIDIGARQGNFSEFLGSLGLKGILFEPLPKHEPKLRQLAERIQSTFYSYALDALDRQADFYTAYDHQNNPLDAFSSLHTLKQDKRIKHIKSLLVDCRSLDSLYREGCVAKEIGIIKIDTEGNELNILKGMTEINSEILICEYFLPGIQEASEQSSPLPLIKEATERLGFKHYIVSKYFDVYEALYINNNEFIDGEWGNLIFIKDSIFLAAKKTLDRILKAKEQRFINQVFANTLALRQSCDERLKIIEANQSTFDQLSRIQESNHDEISNLKKIAEQHLELINKNHAELSNLRIEMKYQKQIFTSLDNIEDSLYRIERYTQTFIPRLKKLIRPHIGILYQYNPIPLCIPKTYEEKQILTKYPRISIVTPSFNQSDFLEKTLLSVIKQEYPDLEYVLKDGGSEDNSLEIINRYQSVFKHWESKKDNGQAHAINIGFGHTTGEIMAYLNSDDILLPGSLTYIAKFFNDHPKIDVIYGHRIVINENDFEIGRWVLPKHQSNILSWIDYIPQETLFWRRSIWEKIGGQLDETFRFAMDWDLLLRFRDAGANFKRLPRFLGGFRVHSQQKTSAAIKTQGALEMAKLRKRCHHRHVTHNEILRKTMSYHIQHFFLHNLYRVGILRY